MKLNTDFFKDREHFESLADKIVFTGMIDEFYEYKFGELEYRSLRFEDEVLDEENHQGNAVVNYTEFEIPYTRIIEHKHFEGVDVPKTIVSYEYPTKYDINNKDSERYYPINDEKNNNLYEVYKQEAEKQKDKIRFCGRLGLYKYDSMDDAISNALKIVMEEINERNNSRNS